MGKQISLNFINSLTFQFFSKEYFFLLNDNTVESIFGIGLKQFLLTLKLLLIS